MNCDDDPLVKAARGLAAPVSRATAGAVNRGGLDPVLRRFVGIFISLGASLFYALGLNIIQRDALRNEARPEHLQRKDYQRLCWYLGMAMFISSQVGGQAFVISFLEPLWVAPLGAVTLIFNCVIAHFLVHTKITRKDVVGTGIVVASVVWVVVWGGVRSPQAPSESTLCYITYLYSRPAFIIYFLIIDSLTLLALLAALRARKILKSERKRRRSKVWRSLSRINLEKWMGMAFAGVGGLLASQTVLLGNSGTSLLEKAFAGDNPFNQGTTLPAFIVAGLVVTAVLQIVCLNNALAVVESVVVVPIFYAFYTAVGLVNNLVYLDEFRYYSWYSLLCITLGIAVLVYGVHLLSVQKTPLAEEFCCSIVDVDGCPPPGEEDEEEANASTTVAAAETDGGAEGAKNEKNAGRGAEGPLAKDGENGVAAFAAARGEAGADDRSLDERSLSSTPVTRSSDVKVVVVERRSRSPPS